MMRKFNFWKTLAFSVMALTAFAGCSDSDDEGGNTGIPSITVNEVASTSVGVTLEGGSTAAIAVVSNGTWTLSMTPTDASSWITPSAMSGAGASSLTFNVAAATAAREATVTLSVTGSVSGYPITKTATILIKQSEGGSTTAETNVAAIREKIKAIATTEGVVITEELTLTGIIITDVAAGGLSGNRNAIVVDNSTTPGSALAVRFAAPYTFAVGQVVTGSIKGAKASNKYGLQVEFTSTTMTAVAGSTVDVQPVPVAAADLDQYDGMYVKVSEVQPVAATHGQFYYLPGSNPAKPASYATTGFETKTGGSFNVSVYKTNSWAEGPSGSTVQPKSGFVCGIVALFQDKGEVHPRNAADVAGLDQPLFEIESTSTTIGSITAAGNYEVKNALVVAASPIAYIIQDATGSMVVYAIDNGRTVGEKINISGAVTIYNATSVPQFTADAAVSVVSSGNAVAYAPTTYDLAKVEAYLTNIKCLDIAIAGKLVKDGNYYNLELPGSTTLQGSIQYYTPDAALDGRNVTVKGFAVGTSKSGPITRIKVMPYEIIPSSDPAITGTPESVAFTAAGEAKTVAFTAANVGSGNKVYAKITGADASQFSVATGAATSPVTVTAATNSTTDSKNATLEIYIAASEVGTAIASATVPLTQAGTASAAGYTKIDKIASLVAGTYYMSGFLEKYTGNPADINYAPYSYHLWTGAVDGGDLATINYQYNENQLTVSPGATEVAVTIELIDAGAANTFYIKIGDKYLKNNTANTNRKLGLVDANTDAAWVFSDLAKGGVVASNSDVYLGTATAASKLLRSYKKTSYVNTFTYGLCFFKAN